MNEINIALLDDFIDECKQHLDEMASLLLQFGDDPGNPDLLNEIFRTMHNVKGAAFITELDKISRLSQSLEDLLDILRQGQMEITSDVIGLLSSGRDRIVQLVSELEDSKQEISSVDELVDQINGLVGGDESAQHENSQTPDTLEPEAAIEADVSSPAAFDAEDYEENNDTELFTIFLGQLKQQFDLLSKASSQFREFGADVEGLNQCQDAVNRLKSSANYMGYDEMVDLFDRWDTALKNATEALSAGEVGSLEFMDTNLDHLISRFPQLADTTESRPAAEPKAGTKKSAKSKPSAKSKAGTKKSAKSKPAAKPKAGTKKSEKKIDDITSSVMNMFTDDTNGDEESDSSVDNAFSEETPDAVPSKINFSLLNEFIDESRENLEEMELLLLRLTTDSDTDHLDTLNEIFRTMHNIKGAAQLTGLDRVSGLAHRLEDLLDLLRQQALATDDVIVRLLIEGRDRIAKLINELDQSQQEISATDDLLEQLTALVEEDDSASRESPDSDQNLADSAAADQPSAEVESAQFSAETKSDNISELSGPRIETRYADEGHDQELFDIFTTHLREQLASIASHSMHFQDSPNQQHRLDDAIEDIKSLHSSANYMGYEELTDFYRLWTDELEKIIQASFRGEQVSLDFMDTYAAELARVFPQIKQDSVETSVAKPLEQPVDIKTAVRQAVDTTDEDTRSTDQENALFNRMESALESSLQNVSSSEHESLEEVFDELVSTQGNGQSPTEVKSAGSGKKAAMQRQLKQAATEAELRDKDRRKGMDTGDKKARKSVRVDAEKIDILMNQVGELVVDRSYFFQLFNEMRELQQYLKDATGIEQKEVKLIRAFTYRFGEAISNLGRTSNELQEGVMKMRMLPVSHLFNRYPRLVYDLTSKLGKKVNLILKGEETELDRMVVEELSDPLIHIIRNSIDHGIESLEERRKHGKPDEGKLILEAFQESNHIVIQVTDDGRGLDPEKIKKTAVTNELFTDVEVERLGEREVLNLILMAGFSTATKITGTSGRGVGMDVVKKNIEKLNGTLDIDSKLGKGTRMRLKIPLTLAIIHALMVRVGGDMFTIPLANVDETVRISQDDTSLVEGVEVIYLRNVALPIFRLSTLFKLAAEETLEKSFVVIVNTDGQRIGFVVDELLGQEEVVIKPLEDYVQEKCGFSGATVIGDGRISLILDIYELVKMTTRQQSLRQQKQGEMLKLAKSRLTEGSAVESDRLH